MAISSNNTRNTRNNDSNNTMEDYSEINLTKAIEKHGAAYRPSGPEGAFVYDVVEAAIEAEFMLKTGTLMPAPMKDVLYQKLQQLGVTTVECLRQAAIRYAHVAYREWTLKKAISNGGYVQYRWDAGNEQLSFRGAFNTEEIGTPNCQTATDPKAIEQLVRDARHHKFQISWGPRVDGDLIQM